MPLSRRRFLSRALALTCTAVPLGAPRVEAEPTDFVGTLRILPKASPPHGVDADPAETTLWGYDGTVPGPVLRTTRGQEIRYRVFNLLPEPTAIHWHGMRVANAMDGAPPLTQTEIAPGDSFEYRLTPPDAGTFWYHPPRHLRRGLHGVFIVDEPGRDADGKRPPLNQQEDQGAALILDNWQIADGAQHAAGEAAKVAEHYSVNGQPSAIDLRVWANTRLRLRLINAADRRVLTLRVSGLRSFVMAIDGQPAQPFAPRNGRLLLGPGNRIDVFVYCEMAKGASLPVLLLEAPSGDIPIAQVTCVSDQTNRTLPLADPQPLTANSLPERMDFSGALRFETPTSGQKAAQGTPLFSVKRGRTVVLGLSNTRSENAYIHLHGHSFRLLDALDDGWKPYWLDTMPMHPQGKARIAFVADNPGKWLIEGLAENGPGAWFEVT